MNSNIIGLIQARTGSTRLPQKVIADICGTPLLTHNIKRVRRSVLCKSFVLCTTVHPADDQLVCIAEKNNIVTFRGSVDDVLDRLYQSARLHGADVIVRITADDPFKDPEIMDSILDVFLNGSYDYVSNTIEPSYPEGLDIEVLSFAALEKANRDAQKPFLRQHVTPYIWMNPDLFGLKNVKHVVDLSDLRWTVDTPEDLAFARAIYEELYCPGSIFLMDDIIKLLDDNEIIRNLMPKIPRNVGFMESMKDDAEANR